MMNNNIYLCYPRCSTCVKIQQQLDVAEISYELRDIKINNPTAEELAIWHKLSGLDIKKFFNTSGLVYKALGLKDKLADMTIDEKYAMLATDGMLVKRPILIMQDKVFVGADVVKNI